MEPKACNAAQRFWESTLILCGQQPEAVEDSEVALNDPRCVARAHPATTLSYQDPGILNLCGLFWLLHTRDCLVREGHTGYWTK